MAAWSARVMESTETIFAWPGLGMLIYRGVANLDMTVVQAGVITVALITILANLISDITYCLIDPNIKY